MNRARRQNNSEDDLRRYAGAAPAFALALARPPAKKRSRQPNLIRRIKRIVRIAELLRKGCATDFNTLSREVGVGRRTLYRDLAILHELGLGFAFSRVQGGYVINSFQIRSRNALTSSEAAAFVLWADHRFESPSNREYTRCLMSSFSKLSEMIHDEFRECQDFLESLNSRFKSRPRTVSARIRTTGTPSKNK